MKYLAIALIAAKAASATPVSISVPISFHTKGHKPAASGVLSLLAGTEPVIRTRSSLLNQKLTASKPALQSLSRTLGMNSLVQYLLLTSPKGRAINARSHYYLLERKDATIPQYIALTAKAALVTPGRQASTFQALRPGRDGIVRLKVPICSTSNLCIDYRARLMTVFESGSRPPAYIRSGSQGYYGGLLRGTGSVGRAGTKVAFVMIPESISKAYHPSSKTISAPDPTKDYLFSATVKFDFALL